MNRIFLSGKVRKPPEVAYTPKGRKIVTFPLWVSEGEFSVQVICGGEPFPGEVDNAVGGTVLVAGELIKTKFESREVVRVKATKILWMEE